MIKREVNSNTINKIINNLKNRFKYDNNIVISCCFSKSKILSYGKSKPDNNLHSIKNNKQFSIHAEIDAINNYYAIYNNKIRKKIGKINILTTRINNNIMLLSKCCQFCIKSLNKVSNIQKIYYTDNNKIYCENFIDIYKNIELLGFSSGDRRILKY